MRELIGLPVMDNLDGGDLGEICDVLFDEQANILLGVLTEPTMGRGLWISREDIQSISPLGVLGTASLCRMRGRRWSDKVGTQIDARDGQVRGTVADVYVNDEFLEVLGYEVSDGLFVESPDDSAVFLERHSSVEDSLTGWPHCGEV